MASIFGFELKNVQKTHGREYEGDLATIYYKGKRVGYYTDYGNGALPFIDFTISGKASELNSLLSEAVKKYFHRFPTTDSDPDGVSFFIELLDLLETEKDYKKFLKTHSVAYAVVANDVKRNSLTLTWMSQSVSVFDKVHALVESGSVNNVREFHSLSDFNIT